MTLRPSSFRFISEGPLSIYGVGVEVKFLDSKKLLEKKNDLRGALGKNRAVLSTIIILIFDVKKYYCTGNYSPTKILRNLKVR